MALTFAKILKEYVDVLDDWQRKVDNIRKMHHEIWKESRIYPIVKQHRAGSRVEKQCRILPVGKQTDVDYKFEVTGITVEMEGRSGLFWKVSTLSNAHGKIFVTEDTKNKLMNKPHYSEIFTEKVFAWNSEEEAYLLLPGSFKENVVEMSKFEYKRDVTPPSNSPSVPGQGAVNEYDIVPCLRISQWPCSVYKWAEDNFSDQKALNKRFRSNIAKTESLFVVPAGNPTSEEKELEFRLSFSLLEVKCFEELSSYARKLYGLIKYVFKMKLEPIDLLDSYHIKSLYFHMIDNEKWSSNDYLEDLTHFFEILKTACKDETIHHIFIEDCNIFPFHKADREKKIETTVDILSLRDEIIEELHLLVRRDLHTPAGEGLSWLSVAEEAINIRQKGIGKEIYINGYLTRLLSLITYSLYENQDQNTLDIATRRVKKLFCEYSNDRNVQRMIPMVNASFERLDTSNVTSDLIDKTIDNCSLADEVSRKVHLAFEAYLHQDFEHIHEYLKDVLSYTATSESTFIGVSITSYHKNFEMDEPLHYAIATLEEKSREHKCPRFYLDPVFLAHHLKIQVRLKIGDHKLEQTDIGTLEKLSVGLSEREPYLGRLSYRYSAILLLQGYRRLQEYYNLAFTAVERENIDSFNQRLYATNFDLR